MNYYENNESENASFFVYTFGILFLGVIDTGDCFVFYLLSNM